MKGSSGMSRKPWQDANGKSLPTEELRRVSQNWSRNTWEQYGTSLETEQEDILVDNFELELQKYGKRELEYREESPTKDFQFNNVEPVVRSLPDMDQQIVRALFWDGLSQREASEALGVSRKIVRNREKAALGRLKTKLLLQGAVGNVHPFPKANQDRGRFLPPTEERVAVNQIYQ